jgi:hypothetical protein
MAADSLSNFYLMYTNIHSGLSNEIDLQALDSFGNEKWIKSLKLKGNYGWQSLRYSTLNIDAYNNIFISGNFLDTELILDDDTLMIPFVSASDPPKIFIAKLNVQLNDRVNNISQIRNNIEIYPNPSSGYLNILLPNFAEQCTINIYDIEGRKIKQLTVNSDPSHFQCLEINLPDAGVFFIQSIFTNYYTINKIIIINN